ncbi:MAG TPA: hypothetical protein VGB90_06600, partial [Alphaproteobacteria bacterium]
MIDLHALHREAAVIDAAVELDHVEPLGEERDEGQEPVALQPVGVEIAGRDVGGCDDNDARIEQRFEQTGEDHRIGNVLHLELVETEKVRFRGDLVRVHGERIAHAAVAAQAVQRVVHARHEVVEMDAALGARRRRLEEQVHQHRLAGPDR